MDAIRQETRQNIMWRFKDYKQLINANGLADKLSQIANCDESDVDLQLGKEEKILGPFAPKAQLLWLDQKNTSLSYPALMLLANLYPHTSRFL